MRQAGIVIALICIGLFLILVLGPANGGFANSNHDPVLTGMGTLVVIFGLILGYHLVAGKK